MNLLPNEHVEFSYQYKKVGVECTNFRVIKKISDSGVETINVVYYNDIASFHTGYKSYRILLVLSIIFMIMALVLLGMGNNAENAPIPIFVSIIFGAIWYFTRKNVFAIETNGGSLIPFPDNHLGRNIIDMTEIISVKKYQGMGSSSSGAGIPLVTNIIPQEKFCKNCNAKVGVNDRFCESCGNII